MEFVDLKKQYITYKDEINKAINKVIDSTSFINGEDIQLLERELADFAGVKYAIGCSSGTDALLIPLLGYNIKPGDEIIVPAFTFIATAEMIAMLNAVPVFADIDPVTYNINAEEIESKITSKTVGIIGVSLFGQCADFNKINDIAVRNNLWVIEDAAQSFGASYFERKSCNLTSIATTSFFPAKPLGCYGDGGAIFTNDKENDQKLRIILNHGQEKRYKHKYIGVNGRLDTIQAAILRVKLKYFSEEIKKRNYIAEKYTEALKDYIKTPEILSHNHSTWAQYTIQINNRDEFREYLQKHEIPTAVHYPIPLYKQETFKYLNVNENNFPVSEFVSNNVVSLPMHAFLTDNEIDKVINVSLHYIQENQ